MDHMRSVAMGVWIKSGSRCEPAESNGISHFVEHMVFKGTKTRSAQAIAREMDSIGGNMDAYTSKETICFSVKSLAEHVPIALDVLSDMVLNPVFAPADIERERGVILEEIKIDEDNPEVLAQELFTQSFWKTSAGQAHPGHQGNGLQARPAAATRLPCRPLPRRQHDSFRGRKSGARPVCRGRGEQVFNFGRRRNAA
jgi:predicted Zn-dependent peptidase